MAHVAHSDWMFEHSTVHHSDTPVDPHPDTTTGTTSSPTTDAAASALKTLWHQADATGAGSSPTHPASNSATGSTSAAAPTLTVTNNALTVNAGGSVSLPITVSPPNGHTSVTISGLTNYETVTDQLDGQTFTPDSHGAVTLSAAEVNSGLSLASNYTGTDHPVNTLTATAAETVGHHTLTSASQSIVVTDPPASTSGSTGSTSGTNSLTLQVSGDQYNGDPQVEVFVDGQQVGGVYTITADHAAGQTQTITINGNFDPTVAHQVAVQFVNDAWDGTSWWSNGTGPDGHDRNVYVESISLNGATLNGTQGTDAATAGEVPTANANEAVMNVNGALTFNVAADPPATASTGTTGSTSSTGTSSASSTNSLTLQVSGDQYNGDPQVEVFVDGQQVGGVYSITADHTAGQTQTITINGNFDPSLAHQVEVQFVNDAWDGTSWWSNGSGPDGHDRNVYVESISLNGTTLTGSQGTDNAFQGQDPTGHATEATMNVNGTLTFNVPDPPATASTGSSSTSSTSSASSSSTSSAPSSSTTGTTGTTGTGASDPAATTDAYYVSPNGSDSNAGTLASPFASLARAQQAMEGSSVKTTYVEAGTYHMSNTLTLTSADDGEVWAYYAASGVDSAILDGGGGLSPVISINGGTSNITIDGLTVQNFGQIGIDAGGEGGQAGVSNVTIENCVVSNGGISGNTTAGILFENVTNSTIENNYVHNMQGMGISLYAYYGGESLNGDVVANNVVLNTVQGLSDGGAIYVDMDGTGTSGGSVSITNNFVRDYGAAGQTDAHGIYLDDNASDVTVTGNVIGAPTVGAGGNSQSGYLVHNGANDVFSNNIVDLGSSGQTFAAVWYQDGGSGMSGDTFTHNIVVSDFTGSQTTSFSGISGTTFYENSAGSNFTIGNNDYYNYAGGPTLTNGPTAGDGDPTFANPNMSGYLYSVASGSAVFSSPVSFTAIAGGWGPQGLTIASSTNASDLA